MKPHSVTDVISSIKDLLEGSFYSVSVEGEVSNFSSSGAGHYYFTLSDENASLSCALFRMDALRNPLIRKVKNGDKVIVTGPISVYSKRGTFQLLAKRISPAGVGDLAQQFAKLKEKLTEQGYFDMAHKKSIPKFVHKVAVITALQGAALQDFLNIMRRRCMWYKIVIVPALVQGENSPASLINALKKAQQIPDVEVILLTRGGGSIEDLWSFNSEKLVQAIFDCPLPVISAVGHQTDITLCDLVSDLRCETPSAAAEVLSQHQKELKQRLRYLSLSLKNFIAEVRSSVMFRISKISGERMLEILKSKFNFHRQKVQRLDLRGKLYDLTRVHESYQYMDELQSRLLNRLQTQYRALDNRAEVAVKVLSGINPNNVLKRGYSYLVTEDGKQVVTNSKKFSKLKKGERLTVHFSDGKGMVSKEV